MSQPTRSDVHVSAPLTNVSIAYIQSASDFVASRLFPMVPVKKQADKYFIYAKKQWFRTDAKKRAPSSESAGSGFEITTDTYFADVFAVHKDVDDQTRTNADEPLDMDRDAALFVARQLLLKKEKEFFSTYFKTGVWSSDQTPSTLWTANGSDPIKDIRAYKRLVKNQTGFAPNKLVVSPDLDDVLKDHAAILDRIKYTQKGMISNELIASVLELDEYMVAEAIEDTAVEGASSSMAAIASTKDALLVYAAPNPGIMTPSAGYTFGWSGLFGSVEGARVSKFRMEHLKSDRVEGEMAFDMKLVASDLGVFISNAIA